MRPDQSVSNSGDRPKTVRAELLGKFTVYDADMHPIELKSKKAKALLAYLLCAPGLKRTREHLAGLLWGASDEAHARASLRQAIAALRRDLADNNGVAILGNDRDAVALAPKMFTTDIDALQNGDLPPSLNDGFLDDLKGLAEPFEEWRRCEAAHLMALVESARGQRIDAARRIGDYDEIISIASVMITVNPLNESAWFEKFNAEKRKGDIGAALATYRRCAAILENELNTAPSDTFRHAAGSLAPAVTHSAPSKFRAVKPSVNEPKNSSRRAPIFAVAAMLSVVIFGAAIVLISRETPAVPAERTASAPPVQQTPKLRRDLEPIWRGERAAERPELASAIKNCVTDGPGAERILSACSTLIDALAASDPLRATALHARASAYLWEGNYALALADAEASFAADPSHYNALHSIAYTYHLMGDPERAINYYRRVREMQPRHVMAAFRMGDALYDLGRYSDAAAEITEAIKLHPKAANFYFARGRAHLANGNRPAAERDLKKAAAMDGTVRQEAERLFAEMRSLAPVDGAAGGPE
ncbi:MAG: tetratricopeptide repeat protein [Marinicaulis sp.]|nr:tetratricopeptide repeat protein [Marinicaulis sp.]NNL89332.1 tetratricopeptide repeat protein [Marinicaulis sp.]